jgi:hypothetical protein
MELKWQQRIIDRARNASNDELFDWLLLCAPGDDYDGCFTDQGWWEYDYLKKEVRRRLLEIGFLKQIKV